jgi:hypothetical protein
MSGKAVVGSMLGSILITVGLIWGLAFFDLLPGLGTNTTNIVNPKNGVIQLKYGEWNSPSYIFDNQLTYVKMTDTELNVTTNGNSSLLVSFSAMSIMTLDAAFTLRAGYNVSLRVEHIGNRTIQVDYFDGGAAYGSIRQISMDLYINYLTPNLPAGTYTVNVYWKSGYDATGTQNSLSVAHMGGSTDYNFTRTLLVQEIRI